MAEDRPENEAGRSRAPHMQAELPASPAKALEPKSAPQLDPDQAMSKPPKTRRRGGAVSRFLNLIGALTVLAALALAGVLTYAKIRFEAMGPLKAPSAIQITPGTSVGAIALDLEEAGIIENAYIFMGAIRLHGAAGRLKAGEYAIPTGASMRTVMNLLVSGKSILHKITLPEGWTSAQIIERVNADPVLVGDKVPVPEEGVLLPETYRFTRGLTRSRFVQQMKTAQTRLLDRLWDKRDPNLPFKTRAEALTLASIVEKETGVASERPHIAGVFVNRLVKGMRLQSDPTVIYGLVGGKGSLGHPLRVSELKSDTPYNTYKIKALPPGPIANPGAAAIRAVLNPMPTKDLFFVADGSGGHAFAENLADHRKNVLKWRKIEQSKPAAPAKDQPAAAPTGKPDKAQPAKAEPDKTKPNKAKLKTGPAEQPAPAGSDSEPSKGSVSINSKPLDLAAPSAGAPAKPK
ncbi:MAG: endolytic transglycosylase MltG [Hyphomicrobiales bacterium]|nr:MAG: endolytic transglycosylase MltG [Hyphomicrobiales bacterium]